MVGEAVWRRSVAAVDCATLSWLVPPVTSCKKGEYSTVFFYQLAHRIFLCEMRYVTRLYFFVTIIFKRAFIDPSTWLFDRFLHQLREEISSFFVSFCR